ncbi:uncharacterized protein BCR38DRAFT_432498, partial [Pseudomassariella vexata]
MKLLTMAIMMSAACSLPKPSKVVGGPTGMGMEGFGFRVIVPSQELDGLETSATICEDGMKVVDYQPPASFEPKPSPSPPPPPAPKPLASPPASPIPAMLPGSVVGLVHLDL